MTKKQKKPTQLASTQVEVNNLKNKIQTIEQEIYEARQQASCPHEQFSITIDKDGYIWNDVVCLNCKKTFSLRLQYSMWWKTRRMYKKIRKRIKKG